MDKDLFTWLENEGLIDQRFVLWWQKGFEGRRVYSGEEFDNTLMQVNYEAKYSTEEGKSKELLDKPKEKTLYVWPKEDVPILLREYSLKGRKIPVFISIKPMSHDRDDGWEILKYFCREAGLPFSEYHQPHIRGIVIEDTSDFLFWFPIGNSPMHYSAIGTRDLFDNQDLYCPIHPSKFYENLVRYQWTKGKRPQRKALEFDCEKEGYKIVPYYDFNINSDHLTIYPALVLEKRLDMPIIIKGNKKTGKPEILGTGSFNFENQESALYWELDGGKQKIARKSLIERLGDLSKKN